jgi:hypothetical protein
MEFGNFSMRFGFRLLDIISSGSTSATSTSNIQQYINLYSGPKYLMHYKYSAIMNIVFIAMMFGAGMPILFPIAAVSLSCFYCLEKFMLYYVY